MEQGIFLERDVRQISLQWEFLKEKSTEVALWMGSTRVKIMVKRLVLKYSCDRRSGG
jgi:hypothetical protein